MSPAPVPPEERLRVVALACEVGINEAHRRTGHSRSAIRHWTRAAGVTAIPRGGALGERERAQRERAREAHKRASRERARQRERSREPWQRPKGRPLSPEARTYLEGRGFLHVSGRFSG
jgi:transposase-like protein